MEINNHRLLLVSVFGRINTDTNDRINSLHDYLSLERKVVTTDFSHRDKTYREKTTLRNADYLHVLPYQKNLSISRILSHWSFAIRLFFYLLENGKKYDFLYCAIPTPSSSFVCSLYKRFFNNKILFIVDVIDVWPEGLIPLGKSYTFLKPIFYIWKLLSIFSYKTANVILAATNSYMNQASIYNDKAVTICCPLGVDVTKIKSLADSSDIVVDKDPDEIWLCYAGNLGASYDFDAIINAVSSLKSNLKFKLIIIGGGDRELEIKNKLDHARISYFITGNLEYKDYLKYLNYCDIGFNIYVENSEVIQSYKFNDYVVSGMYVMNSLKGETADLINKYEIGKNIVLSNTELILHLQETIDNWNFLKLATSKNCLNLVDEVLDKKKIYPKIEDVILNMIK